jgi:hypothetical protein
MLHRCRLTVVIVVPILAEDMFNRRPPHLATRHDMLCLGLSCCAACTVVLLLLLLLLLQLCCSTV